MANSSWANIPQDFARSGAWAVSTLAQTFDAAGNPVMRGGKPVIDKAPRHPKTGLLLDMTHPETWATFEECAASTYPAIGRLLQFGDGYVGIDLDAIPEEIDPDHRDTIRRFQLTNWETFQSYAERSQSGNGCHILVRADLNGGFRQPGYEVYGHNRYLITTGDVIRDLPIQPYQSDIDQLAEFMASQRVDYGLPEDQDDEQTVEEIIERASRARNGEKFKSLFYTDPADGDDWSGLDAALAQMIVFYTWNHRLAVEVFARSALWRGDGSLNKKRGYESPSKYVHDYLLGRTLARAWSLRKRDEEEDVRRYEENLQRINLQKQMNPEPEPTPGDDPYDYAAPTYEDWTGPKVSWPESGLIQEVAQYCYESASHPVGEFALAAAVAFLAGVAGRNFHTYTGSKLTHYVVTVAGTGRGKDSGPTSIRRLVNEVSTTLPAIAFYEGPALIASGQALAKSMPDHPSAFSFIGEFGLTLQRITNPNANMADKQTRIMLLDLYSSSRLGKSIHSDKDKNSEAVDYPNFSFLGDTTPSTYYAAMDADRVAEGLAPRLLEIVYSGPRVRLNPFIGTPPKRELVEKVAELVRRVEMLKYNTEPYYRVPASTEAKRILDRLGNYADYQINHSEDAAAAELWNRAAMKVLRLATLMAVCDLGDFPMVQTHHVEWAKSVIWPSTAQLLLRFKSGDVGEGEITFESHVVKAVRRYVAMDEKTRLGYKVPTSLACEPQHIPFTYLRRALRLVAEFKKHRNGAARAIQDAVADAVRGEVLLKVPDAILEGRGLRGGEVYMLGPQFPPLGDGGG